MIGLGSRPNRAGNSTSDSYSLCLARTHQPARSEHFRAQGFAVLVPELDPTRGVEFRGNQLGDQINSSFNSGLLDRNQKTHIVAHSMGGLDSRYLLSPVSEKRLVAPVRSLTTISTPHQGSPIADLIDKPLDLLPFPHLPFSPAGNPLGPRSERVGHFFRWIARPHNGFLSGILCQVLPTTRRSLTSLLPVREGLGSLRRHQHFSCFTTTSLRVPGGQTTGWSPWIRRAGEHSIRQRGLPIMPKRWDTTWIISSCRPPFPILRTSIESSQT